MHLCRLPLSPLSAFALTFYECSSKLWLWPSIPIKLSCLFIHFLKLTRMAFKPDLSPRACPGRKTQRHIPPLFSQAVICLQLTKHRYPCWLCFCPLSYLIISSCCSACNHSHCRSAKVFICLSGTHLKFVLWLIQNKQFTASKWFLSVCYTPVFVAVLQASSIYLCRTLGILESQSAVQNT